MRRRIRIFIPENRKLRKIPRISTRCVQRGSKVGNVSSDRTHTWISIPRPAIPRNTFEQILKPWWSEGRRVAGRGRAAVISKARRKTRKFRPGKRRDLRRQWNSPRAFRAPHTRPSYDSFKLFLVFATRGWPSVSPARRDHHRLHRPMESRAWQLRYEICIGAPIMWNGFVIFAFPFFPPSPVSSWNEIKEEIGGFSGLGGRRKSR